MTEIQPKVESNESPSENTPKTIDVRIDVIAITPSATFLQNEKDQAKYTEQEQEEDLLKIVPGYATIGSAGIDLHASIRPKIPETVFEALEADGPLPEGIVTIKPGETVCIPTGFNWTIPAGYVGMVCSRSGLALKQSLFVLNAPGIIDSDYRGEVGVVLHNIGKEPQVIVNGDRIAQMVVLKTSDLLFSLTREQSTNTTERGTGGFGSTGQ